MLMLLQRWIPTLAPQISNSLRLQGVQKSRAVKVIRATRAREVKVKSLPQSIEMNEIFIKCDYVSVLTNI